MRTGLFGLVLGALLVLASPAPADYLFNFSTPTGDLGTSASYSSNGSQITAYGYTYGQNGNPNQATDLYGKNGSGDEHGLGLNSTKDHEIDKTHFVQLDLQSLLQQGVTSVLITMGSVQSKEGYDVYLSDVLGSPGTEIIAKGNLDEIPFAVSLDLSGHTYRYISFDASSGNVLVSSLTASPVPEPGSLALGLVAGVGMCTFGWYRQRRQARAGAR